MDNSGQGQGKARKGRARQDKARQGKTNHDKTRQIRTKQDKAGQSKTRQDNSGQGQLITRTTHNKDKARRGLGAEGKAEQGRARLDWW